MTRALPTKACDDDEIVDVEVVVVLGVGDGALEALADVARDALLRELEVGQRRRDLLAADELRRRGSASAGETRSMRATAFASLSGSARGAAALPMAYFLFAFLSAAWPWKVRVGENSPNLWPTISSDDVDRDVLLAVVDAEGEADELRQDRGAAAPDLDHLVAAGAARGLGLLEEVAVDERALPDERVIATALTSSCERGGSTR